MTAKDSLQCLPCSWWAATRQRSRRRVLGIPGPGTCASEQQIPQLIAFYARRGPQGSVARAQAPMSVSPTTAARSRVGGRVFEIVNDLRSRRAPGRRSRDDGRFTSGTRGDGSIASRGRARAKQRLRHLHHDPRGPASYGPVQPGVLATGPRGDARRRAGPQPGRARTRPPPWTGRQRRPRQRAGGTILRPPARSAQVSHLSTATPPPVIRGCRRPVCVVGLPGQPRPRPSGGCRCRRGRRWGGVATLTRRCRRCHAPGASRTRYA